MSERDAAYKAIGHGIRARLLAQMILAPRTACCPRDLAKSLDESLGVVAYHVRILERLGMLKLARTKPARGATTHYYRLTALGRETAKAPRRIVIVMEETIK